MNATSCRHCIYRRVCIVMAVVLCPAACADGVELFWTGNQHVRTANTIERVIRDVALSTASTGGVDVAGGFVFWTAIETGQVFKTPIGGGGSIELFDGPTLSSVVGVTVDEMHGKVYWTDGDARTITQANVNGGERQTIVNTSFFNPPGAITVDPAGQRLYWAAYPGGIFSANTDGSDVKQIVPTGGDSSIADIVVDPSANRLYWTDFRLSSISSSHLDGTDVEKILQFPTFTDPKGIDLDPVESKLYWVTGAGGKIQRANLDGSNLEDMFVGLNDPIDLEIGAVPEPASLGLLAFTPFCIRRPRRRKSVPHNCV